MPWTFSPPPLVSDPDMHHGTCVTHLPWCMPGSLTSGFLWNRWRGNRSRHSQRMRNPQFYVSVKRPDFNFQQLFKQSIKVFIRFKLFATLLAHKIWFNQLLKPSASDVIKSSPLDKMTTNLAENIFRNIFMNEKFCIVIRISLKFVPKGPINNIPALVEIIARPQPGNKPLSESMMIILLSHICVIRPQWVKQTIHISNERDTCFNAMKFTLYICTDAYDHRFCFWFVTSLTRMVQWLLV